MHAYCMKDCARERYIFYLAIAAVTGAAAANYLAGSVGITIGLTTLSVFTVLFLVFDRWAWRLPLVSRFVRIPDLSGTWNLTGRSNGADGQERDWSAVARIEQSWSRIAISIETVTSRSRSGMAAVEHDPGHGFRLLYRYTNEPKTASGELRSHRGTCEVVFNADLTAGQGTYFNDHQRRTVGDMTWTRVFHNGA